MINVNGKTIITTTTMVVATMTMVSMIAMSRHIFFLPAQNQHRYRETEARAISDVDLAEPGPTTRPPGALLQ